MKYYIKEITILLVLFSMANCDNANDLLNEYIKDGPIIYAAKVDSMVMQSGLYRLRVNVYPAEDANRSHCILSWNVTSGVKDSVRMDYTMENYDTNLGCYYTVIDVSSDEIQGNLLIESQNVDAFGNRSLTSNKGAFIYGAVSLSTLTNSLVTFSSNFDEIYFENKIGSIGNYFSYELENGEFTEEVFVVESSYPLVNAKYGGIVRVKTKYHLNIQDIDYLTVMEYSETIIPKERMLISSNIKPLSVFNYSYASKNLDYDTYGVDPITGIQNDGNYYNANYGPETIFDGNLTTNAYYGYKFKKSSGELVNSFYSTYDLNVDVKLTKIKIYPRTANVYQYGSASVKRFRIWGTNDANSERFSKFPETWTLIGEYIGRDPVDPNNLTQEERDYFLTKNEFRISEDNVEPNANPHETFRYMRLESVESYDPNAIFYVINEIQLKGEIDVFH